MSSWKIYILLYLWMSWFRVSSFSKCSCSFSECSALDKRTCSTHPGRFLQFPHCSLDIRVCCNKQDPFSKPEGLWNLLAFFWQAVPFWNKVRFNVRRKKEMLQNQTILQYSREDYLSVLIKALKVISYLASSRDANGIIGLNTGNLVLTFLLFTSCHACLPQFFVFSCSSRKICGLSNCSQNSMFHQIFL